MWPSPSCSPCRRFFSAFGFGPHPFQLRWYRGYVHELAPPSVKQHLATIRILFDWLIVGQVIPMNPAASVRGPKHVVKKGKTIVLSNDNARGLIDSIEVSTLSGLRDRALIGVMVYSFARVSAVVGCRSAIITKTADAPGSAFWKKAASTTKCPLTTMPRLTSMPISRRRELGQRSRGRFFVLVRVKPIR